MKPLEMVIVIHNVDRVGCDLVKGNIKYFVLLSVTSVNYFYKIPLVSLKEQLHQKDGTLLN